MDTTEIISPYTRDKVDQKKIAVLIPCYNEEAAVGQVVLDFKKALPEANIYVYDNNSSDRTAQCAKQAGAIVRFEARQGKGHVVRRMFSDIDADIYILVDGDATYDASISPELIDALIEDNLDMVVGARLTNDANAYRQGHQFGNKMLTSIVRFIFGHQFTDMLSGYRAFSRRFVKSFPTVSKGFEIETEITVHALQMYMPVGEVKTLYGARPEGSSSKLSTYKDGFRILIKIISLLKEFKPFALFSTISLMLGVLTTVLISPVIFTYIKSGIVPRFPSLILATGTLMMSFLSLACGIILDDVSRGRLEMKRLIYLSNLPAKANYD